MYVKAMIVSAVIVSTSGAGIAAQTDSCLIGTWVPEAGEFADQMAASPGMGEVEVSGDVQMRISALGGEYLLDGLRIKVQNPGMPPMEVAMSGSGAFSGEADGGRFEFTMGEFDYAARATINMGGPPVVMDIPFTQEMAPMGGGATGRYACTDTSLRFEVEGQEGKMLENWRRQ